MSAHRVADRFYARMFKAMTYEQAKGILGIPPGSSPSPEEIKKIYLKKVWENHPDRGGSTEKMVEINIAKEILDGKTSPAYDRPSGSPSSYGYSPADYGYAAPRRDPEPDNVVTFDQAKSTAGIPADVEWFFVTSRQRSASNYSGDESESGNTAFVAYGQTADKHVFAAALNNRYQAYFVGGGPKTDVWKIRSIELPRKEGEKIEPAWLVGQIVKVMRLIGSEAKFNSKVISVKGKNWKFDDKSLIGNSTSVKNVMVDLGMVTDDDPSVSSRKQIVEMKVTRDYIGMGGNDVYQFTLIINGREFSLSPEENKRIEKLKVSGDPLINVIWGTYLYNNNPKKTLTRLRSGKKILKWLGENLTSLPDAAKAALLAASDQMK